MTTKNKRDYLYVIWKNPKSRRQYIIGELGKSDDGKYDFCYCHEIHEAINNGFQALISFDDIDNRYTSDKLFTPFASRLPDKKRKDIGKILRKYNMTEYDEYTLLKKSEGILPIDTIKFIEPILEIPEYGLEKKFYIAGVRHYVPCNGKECIKFNNIHESDNLSFELEPSNKYDEYAIKVIDNGVLVGYIPRYYSKQLSNLINSGFNYKCLINKVKKNNECDECIQVSLSIQRKKLYA